MSACRCPESTKADVKQRAWRVLQRCCNHSKFNGGHWTPSAWSELQCRACGAIWRTKANYVAKVPNAQADWWKTPAKIADKLIADQLTNLPPS